ncbi:MAG: hypothetical protein P8J81_03660, partial [Luminiphilus sp.]|nr:hypothetical protein [Luminiphilus sp.]
MSRNVIAIQRHPFSVAHLNLQATTQRGSRGDQQTRTFRSEYEYFWGSHNMKKLFITVVTSLGIALT